MSVPFGVDALEAIANRAADVARRGASEPLAVTEKEDLSPVTDVDHAVNDFLRRELRALLPGSGWLSEESADDPSRLDARWVWIVDPIDGTSQLVRRIPEVAISIGLADRGRVVAAAIVNPMTRESGSWVEGAPPRFHGLTPRPSPVSLDEVVAIVSRSETEDGELLRYDRVVGTMRPVGSIAYKLLRVASGADTLTFSLRPKFEWDICAGVGLLTATGCVYARLDGRPVVFNQPDPRIASGAVAAPAGLALPLVARLNALGTAP